MAQCITCGTELHPERAQKYDYCMAPECQEKNAKGLTMVAIGMNKAADELVILDEPTREALANGKYQDQRRGSFGPPAPFPAAARPTTEAAAPGTNAATPGTNAATPGTNAATPGTNAATPGTASTTLGTRDGCRGRPGPGGRAPRAPAPAAAVPAHAGQRHPAEVDRFAGAARAALQPAGAAAG